VVGKGLLSEEQYKEVVSFAKQLPYLRVAKAFFKVTGERFIIPSSLVTLVVKGRFVPPGSENVPEVNEIDLEDVDPAEDDLDAILGRKSRKQVGKDEKGKPIMAAVDNKLINPPLASSPYFARDYSPRWHVFLTDSKQGRVAVPPFTFAQFDQPIFEADGKTPTFAMQTLKAQFQAPPQAGHYTFVMHVVCDSYVGFDTKMEVTLIVEEASKAEEMTTDEEISEPEEGECNATFTSEDQVTNSVLDSIAGIMHAAKGGAPPKKKKKQQKEEEEEEESSEEESSDEDSSDEDSSDDTSDTNTDTEDEE
jgi:translocation protein SEC63